MIKKYSTLVPIYGDKTPEPISQSAETLLVYLSPVNSPEMKDRMGTEKVVSETPASGGKILETKSQFKGWRFIFVNLTGEFVAAMQGVSKEKVNIIFNIYTRRDYRKKGIMTQILNVVKSRKKNLYVDSNMTKDGARFMKFQGHIAQWFDFAEQLNLKSVPEEGSLKKEASSEEAKQTDAFFENEAWRNIKEGENKVKEIFRREKVYGVPDKYSPGNFSKIISRSPTNPNKIRVTDFIEGRPSGHTEYTDSDKGWDYLFQMEYIFQRRKDIPDWAFFGNAETALFIYKMKSGNPPPRGFNHPVKDLHGDLEKGYHTFTTPHLLSQEEIDKFKVEPIGYIDSQGKNT